MTRGTGLTAALFFACSYGCQAAAPPPGGGLDVARVRPDAAPGPDATSDAGPSDMGPPDAGSGLPECPPQPPFGATVGSVAPELALLDCDGVSHSLHALCERDAIWLFELADWCPTCRTFAMDHAGRIYDRFHAEAGERFEAWVVVSETASFGPATQATCAEIRERYSLTMPVLFDPEGLFQRAFSVPSNEVQVVLTRGARIAWSGRYAGAAVESEIATALE